MLDIFDAKQGFLKREEEVGILDRTVRLCVPRTLQHPQVGPLLAPGRLKCRGPKWEAAWAAWGSMLAPCDSCRMDCAS